MERSESRRRQHRNVSGLAGIRARPDHDLHVLIERREKFQQAFDGALEQFIDGQRQARLRLPFSGIGLAKIGEDSRQT